MNLSWVGTAGSSYLVRGVKNIAVQRFAATQSCHQSGRCRTFSYASFFRRTSAGVRSVFFVVLDIFKASRYSRIKCRSIRGWKV